jgi:Ca-activated chloride channel family protein
MRPPLSLLILWGAGALAGAFSRTNSRAAAERGVEAFAKRDYARATDAFAQSNTLRPTPAGAFNLGTAQIAGGKREEGSATLAHAMADLSLRADALYNRGNSALTSNAYDYAIRDYIATLKLRPNDAKAKRNLEIALQRKQAMQQSRGGQQKNAQGEKGGNQQQTPRPSQGPKHEEASKQEASAEALLRAVQQQEQEELQRMKKARAEKVRVGW